MEGEIKTYFHILAKNRQECSPAINQLEANSIKRDSQTTGENCGSCCKGSQIKHNHFFVDI